MALIRFRDEASYTLHYLGAMFQQVLGIVFILFCGYGVWAHWLDRAPTGKTVSAAAAKPYFYRSEPISIAFDIERRRDCPTDVDRFISNSPEAGEGESVIQIMEGGGTPLMGTGRKRYTLWFLFPQKIPTGTYWYFSKSVASCNHGLTQIISVSDRVPFVVVPQPRRKKAVDLPVPDPDTTEEAPQ